MTTVLFVSLFALFLIEVPIAFALGISSLVYLVFQESIPLILIPQRMITGTDSFPFMAIPFFLLAGGLMEGGGISQRLIKFASAIVGHIRGGLATVSVVACMFFAAISGSAAATTAAIGGVTVKSMVEKGYGKGFAAGLLSCAGCIGVIIPPSITMVVFGVIAGASIGRLFLGGFIPGLLIGLGLILVSYFFSVRRNYPTEPSQSAAEKWISFKESIWALLMPVIVLGGILGGIFTPTEAAAVACLYGIIIGIYVYKEMTWSSLPEIFFSCALNSSIIMILISIANVFGWIVAAEQIPQAVASALLSFSTDKNVIYFLILIIYLIVGTFMETGAALIILVPVLLPLTLQLGIDTIHFGVVTTIALAIGMATPPVGICLFVASAMCDISMTELSKNIPSFLGVMILVLFLVTFIPELIMVIPNAFMGTVGK